MNYLELPDLAIVNANLDTWALESQKLLEQAIKKYISFKEAEIDADIAYTKKTAVYIAEQQTLGDKITILKEKAKAYCIDEYAIMKRAESKKRHYEKYIGAFESRINLLKMLMKRKLDR